MLLHPAEPTTNVLTAAGITVEEILRAISRLHSSQNVASAGGAPQAFVTQRRLAELRQQVEDWRECN